MAVYVASITGLSGCGENIFDQKWTEARVDTVLIYSLARPELNLPSAFDFVKRLTVELQSPGATGEWDLVVDTRDGQLVFLPPGSLGFTSEMMFLAIPGMAFNDVIKAPGDTTQYTKDTPLVVDANSVYVLRTHQGFDRFGLPCLFYGKFQPLVVDPANGSVEFEYDVSRLCDDRSLIPPA